MAQVSLRKLVDADIKLIETHFQSLDGASESQWFGFWNTNSLRARLAQDQFIGTQDGALSIALGDTTVGKVDWFTSTAWGRANTSACWEIAVGIFADYRGQGIGTQAQRLLIDYLFTHYPRHRIQATTAAQNIAEQRVLDSLGFILEGTVRKSQWRGGAWHDQLLYSLLRDEWQPSTKSQLK
ncbi:GNAT family protein [Glutamicibacter sp.]|uniref:GNAT family N-acetyltransferase n=1 Tax=Glutamicibacter sp. TaxID=1931995 RepID=UPI0028BE676F|nr:GNAT family protein [Glutamicibacter sp.]